MTRGAGPTFADRTFTVTNRGAGTLNLSTVRGGRVATSVFDDFGISASIPAEVTSLAPGQSTQFTVRFDPDSNPGWGAVADRWTSVVKVYSNDPDTPVYRFAVTGQGIA